MIAPRASTISRMARTPCSASGNFCRDYCGDYVGTPAQVLATATSAGRAGVPRTDEGRLGQQPGLLVGMVMQQRKGAADQISRRLMARVQDEDAVLKPFALRSFGDDSADMTIKF